MADRLPKWQKSRAACQNGSLSKSCAKSKNIFGMKLALANAVPNLSKNRKSFVKIS